MKSVAEIKKSVELCSKGIGVQESDCLQCPYDSVEDCLKEQARDILAMIRQFEERADQRELDFAKQTAAIAEERLEMLKMVRDYCNRYSGWIPVEESLPELFTKVLVIVQYKSDSTLREIKICSRYTPIGSYHTEWRWGLGSNEEVTHWMSLPKPPEVTHAE